MIFRKADVLIIDDEKVLLEMLHLRLTKFGFTVDVAGSAEEGIEKIHNSRCDLILTDIKMPGMSGNDLLKYVKDNMKLSIPIIAMSGTPWLFEHSHFDAVIAKPFSKEDLLTVISQFIQPPQL